MCFLATLGVFFIAGCGQETVTIPGVVSVTPTAGETGVIINTSVSATFSMEMDPASITTGTFTLTGQDGTAVAGGVTYSGRTATFRPMVVLAYGMTYTATITTGTENPAGARLLANYVWSFTTVTPTLVAPTVVSAVPVKGAANVFVGRALTATFSEVMNSGSISATTFTVSAG
jgi:hypothetical protein